MQLVRYEPRYLQEVLRLHRSAVATFELGLSRQEDEADLVAIEHIYLEGGEFLVGLLGQRLIAMGGFRRLSEKVAELRRMRIDGGLQGRGYGTQLLKHLERRALELGIRELCLETAEARPLTLQFYKKHGYHETGVGVYGTVRTIRFSRALDLPT